MEYEFLPFQKLQLGQELVENSFFALQALHQLMPSSDSDLTRFFAGEPPSVPAASQESVAEEKREGEREEEGEGEEEVEREGGGS